MQLSSRDIQPGQPLDPKLAFGRPDGQGGMQLSDNLNPHLAWRDAPAGTASYVLLCVDPDVPAVADDVNQAGVVLPESMPRTRFYHWVMANIPAGVNEISSGSCSKGVTVGGKRQPAGPAGSVQGLNHYTQFLAGSEMAGEYYGYDGPCPPWNDERLHHYHFVVYALDLAQLPLPEQFTAEDALVAMEGHVMASAELMGTYTLYAPRLSG